MTRPQQGQDGGDASVDLEFRDKAGALPGAGDGSERAVDRLDPVAQAGEAPEPRPSQTRK